MKHLRGVIQELLLTIILKYQKAIKELKMDKCREEFEAWIKSETGFDLHRTQFPMTKYEDQQYHSHNTNMAWLSWKASREGIKAIKFPEATFETPSGDNALREDAVIDAITSAGYKVE